MSPWKRPVTLRARGRSRTSRPSSMFRSRAASVRLAEVTKTDSSSATTALAWRTPAGAVRVQGTGVVVDGRAGGAGPLCAPEAVGEAAHQVVGTGGVAAPALDVEQQRRRQRGLLFHAVRQNGERLGAVEEREGAGPQRSLGGAHEFLVDAAGVSGVQAADFGAGPHQVGGAGWAGRVGGRSQPCRGGPAGDLQRFQLAEAGENVVRMLIVARAQGGAKRGRGRRGRHQSGRERAFQPTADMGGEAGQRGCSQGGTGDPNAFDVRRVARRAARRARRRRRHDSPGKKAASSWPITGTTNARSR